MQLFVSHNLDTPLVLPLGYHHIIQSVLYRTLKQNPVYSRFLHDSGYDKGGRSFKLFTFGPLQGRYTVQEKRIIFTERVSFEVRSIEPVMLQLLKEGFESNGITYGTQTYHNIELHLTDKEIEAEELTIRMKSPICVYSTDRTTGKTMYYSPEDEAFSRYINENFRRKYQAYIGVFPEDDIRIRKEWVTPKDKYVTRYKGFYINGWNGTYVLSGKRRYLDFLYQTGLGSKNAQGFGMFEAE